MSKFYEEPKLRSLCCGGFNFLPDFLDNDFREDLRDIVDFFEDFLEIKDFLDLERLDREVFNL